MLLKDIPSEPAGDISITFTASPNLLVDLLTVSKILRRVFLSILPLYSIYLNPSVPLF